MAKTCSSNVKLQGLNYIVANASKLIVCAGQPPTYAAAMATANNMIATWAMTTGTGTDYQKVESGTTYTLEVLAQSSLVPAATVVADHIALVSTALSELIMVTTCATQLITSTSNKINVSTWTIKIGDAT